MGSSKVALVGWELGAGRGHLEHLKPVVAALLGKGWTVIAAVRDLQGGHAVFGEIDAALRHRRLAIGQAPIFLHRADRSLVRPSSLAEILANVGFADASLLRPVLETWVRLIEAVKPAVILGDFAPSVTAAAQGRVPVIMTGNGWTIPPEGSPVPPLPIKSYDKAAAVKAEEGICKAVEDALGGTWRPRSFAHLLRGDERFIYTSEGLDPYRGVRRDRLSWPPNLVIPEMKAGASAGHCLIYLPPHHPAIDRVLAALAEQGMKAYAYFGGLQPAAPKNVLIETLPIDLSARLPGAKCAIHHGGLGISNWCIAYEVTQVVMPVDLEKGLISHAIESMGMGVSASLQASSAEIAAAISQAVTMTQPTLPAKAAGGSASETVRSIVQACERLSR